MRYLGPIHKEVDPGGDRYVGAARTLLGQVQYRMKLNGLAQLVGTANVGDAKITAGIVHGQPFVRIRRKVDEKEGTVLAGDWALTPRVGFLDGSGFRLWEAGFMQERGWEAPYFSGGEPFLGDGVNQGTVIAASNSPTFTGPAQRILRRTANGNISQEFFVPEFGYHDWSHYGEGIHLSKNGEIPKYWGPSVFGSPESSALATELYANGELIEQNLDAVFVAATGTYYLTGCGVWFDDDDSPWLVGVFSLTSGGNWSGSEKSEILAVRPYSLSEHVHTVTSVNSSFVFDASAVATAIANWNAAAAVDKPAALAEYVTEIAKWQELFSVDWGTRQDTSNVFATIRHPDSSWMFNESMTEMVCIRQFQRTAAYPEYLASFSTTPQTDALSNLSRDRISQRATVSFSVATTAVSGLPSYSIVSGSFEVVEEKPAIHLRDMQDLGLSTGEIQYPPVRESVHNTGAPSNIYSDTYGALGDCALYGLGFSSFYTRTGTQTTVDTFSETVTDCVVAVDWQRDSLVELTFSYEGTWRRTTTIDYERTANATTQAVGDPCPWSVSGSGEQTTTTILSWHGRGMLTCAALGFNKNVDFNVSGNNIHFREVVRATYNTTDFDENSLSNPPSITGGWSSVGGSSVTSYAATGAAEVFRLQYVNLKAGVIVGESIQCTNADTNPIGFEPQTLYPFYRAAHVSEVWGQGRELLTKSIHTQTYPADGYSAGPDSTKSLPVYFQSRCLVNAVTLESGSNIVAQGDLDLRKNDLIVSGYHVGAPLRWDSSGDFEDYDISSPGVFYHSSLGNLATLCELVVPGASDAPYELYFPIKFLGSVEIS